MQKNQIKYQSDIKRKKEWFTTKTDTKNNASTNNDKAPNQKLIKNLRNLDWGQKTILK